MRPRPLLSACLLALGLRPAGRTNRPRAAAKSYKDPGLYAGTAHRERPHAPRRIPGRDLAIARKGSFAARFWPGVNLGATVRAAPGEVAPTRQDYDRWLDGMGDLGVRVVRVYTILRPAFYDALAAYNRRHPKTPLCFIQGVWIPEEEFLATENAYDAVTDGFDARDRRRGRCRARRRDAPRAPRACGRHATAPTSRAGCSPGRSASSGTRTRSPTTDAANAGAPPYQGRYIRATAGATPMESWLASMLDHLADARAARGWSRPLTFTNWLTVDPLEHPRGAAGAGGPRLGRRHAPARHRARGRAASSPATTPIRTTPTSCACEYRTTARARQVDPYPAYLRDAARAPRRSGGDDHRVRRAERPRRRAPRPARARPGRPLRAARPGASTPTCCATSRRRATPAAMLFEWIDEWFKLTWNTHDLELPATAVSSGATTSPTRSSSARRRRARQTAAVVARRPRRASGTRTAAS